jgi:hypothetical protein
MPRGIVALLTLNLVFVAVSAGNLLVFYAEGVTRTMTFIASWGALACLLATVVGLLLKGRLWHKLSRSALYALALIFGLQLIASLPQIAESHAMFNVAGLVFGILYVVGARGYLNSPAACKYFGIAVPESAAQ